MYHIIKFGILHKKTRTQAPLFSYWGTEELLGIACTFWNLFCGYMPVQVHHFQSNTIKNMLLFSIIIQMHYLKGIKYEYVFDPNPGGPSPNAFI